MPARPAKSDCPIASSLALLGDKWSLLIVRDMMVFEKSTFKEFLASPEGIPTNTLTTRLRQLEEAGLIARQAYQENPVRYRYQLTEAGKGLAPVLKALRNWCDQHIESKQELSPPKKRA